MGTQRKIYVEVFDAANIKAYADSLEYNRLIPALAELVSIYEENHMGRGNKEIDIEDFNYIICSIIRFCNSVEALRNEVNHALELKDLKPYY